MTSIDKELLDGFLISGEDKEQPAPKLQTSVRDNYKNNPSMQGLFKDLHGGKMMSQKELIEDIEMLIAERESLQKEVFGDIENLMVGMNNFLTSAGDKIDVVEQLKLREKLIDVEEFKMQEKINAFRDVAMLKRELRDRVAEFKERENRMNVIDDLVGE